MLDILSKWDGEIKPPREIKFDSQLILDYKIKAAYKSMELTIQAACADKITFDKVRDIYNELNQYLWDAIDECASE